MTEATDAMESLDVLDFSEEEMEQRAKKKSLPDGAWLQWVVTKQETKINEKSGNAGTRVTLRALKTPNDPKSKFGPPASYFITWPFRNTKFTYPENHKDKKKGQAHVAPDTEGMVISFFHALGKDADGNTFPTFPQWKDGSCYYKGAEIAPEDEPKFRKEVMNLMKAKYQAIIKDDNFLVDEAFYGQVANDGNFVNVKNPSSSLPEDAVYGKASETDD